MNLKEMFLFLQSGFLETTSLNQVSISANKKLLAPKKNFHNKISKKVSRFSQKPKNCHQMRY